MLQVRFEPKIPVFERVKRVHALDRAATVIGEYTEIIRLNFVTIWDCWKNAHFNDESPCIQLTY
jgi:hypothetical protein